MTWHVDEAHAAARDGWWLLSSDPGVYAEAPSYWPFHLLFLLTPSLQGLAPLLAGLHGLFTAVVAWAVARRFGAAMAWGYAALHVSMPVYWILNTHVISTYFSPLLGPLYFLALYDLLQPGAKPGAERRAWWLGAGLVLLHRANALYLVPLIAAHGLLLRRRPKALTLGVFGLMLVPSVQRLVRDGFFASHALHAHDYNNPWEFLQRFIFTETGIESFLPAAWAFYPLALFAMGYLIWKRPEPAKPFVWAYLSVPLLWFPESESSVPSEFLVLMSVLFVAQRLRGFRWGLNAYVVAFVATQAFKIATFGPLPNAHFLSLSSTGSRTLMLDALMDRFDITASEMETVDFKSEWGEYGTRPYPSMLPGTSYYVDRLIGPLPEGGSRCFLVADETYEVPDYGPTTRTEHVPPWNITAWEQQAPCPGNIRVDRGQPAFIDLRTFDWVTFPPMDEP